MKARKATKSRNNQFYLLINTLLLKQDVFLLRSQRENVKFNGSTPEKCSISLYLVYGQIINERGLFCHVRLRGN